MLTKSQIDSAMEFHYGKCTRHIGPRGGVTENTVRLRRNGATKYWKTRPDEFRIPVKYGFKGHAYVDHFNVNQVHAAEDCPLRDTKGEVK